MNSVALESKGSDVLQARMRVKFTQGGWQEDFASAPILFRLLHETSTPGFESPKRDRSATPDTAGIDALIPQKHRGVGF